MFINCWALDYLKKYGMVLIWNMFLDWNVSFSWFYLLGSDVTEKEQKLSSLATVEVGKWLVNTNHVCYSSASLLSQFLKTEINSLDGLKVLLSEEMTR